jgi:hypothetical protein
MYWRFSFPLPVLKKIVFFYIKAVKVSRRHFWKFYELIWFPLQFGRISWYFSIWYPAGYPAFSLSGIWQGKSVIRPDCRCIPIK